MQHLSYEHTSWVVVRHHSEVYHKNQELLI